MSAHDFAVGQFYRINPFMDGPDFIGLLAAILTTSANVPQVIKTYRTRSGEGLSARMLFTLALGLALWLTYGILRKDLSLILANAAGLTLTLTLLWLKRRYDRANAQRDTLAA